MEAKIVQKFGNSGHIVLPKEYIGKRIRFAAEPKTFEDIKSEILEILKPYSENIVGIYLYGSYARNEQAIDSDIDILAITGNKLRIIKKINDYAIVSVTAEGIEAALKKNAVLALPIINEAKTIINPDLLNKYRNYRFTKDNTKGFINSSERILELNKKGLELGFEAGSLIYSLILRVRGILMIKLMLGSRLYSKAALLDYLEDNDLPKNKVVELYKIYTSEKNGIRVKESEIIAKADIEMLLLIAEKLLEEVKSLLQ